MNKDELIMEFYRSKMKELLREYDRTDTIASRFYLIAIDPDGEPMVAYRPCPKVMYYEGQALGRAWQRLAEYKQDFIQSVSEDGSKVVALLHVEYEEDLSTGLEVLFCTMTMGRSMKKYFMKHYYIQRFLGWVNEDGTYIPSTIKFKPIVSTASR
jgi:hypothetical protein